MVDRAIGHDLSHYQGDRTFAQCLQNDDFVGIKATDGAAWKDPEFNDTDDHRWNAMGAAVESGRLGLRIAYSFLEPGNGAAQADHLIDVAGKPGAGTRLAFDWEAAALNVPDVLGDAVKRHWDRTGTISLVYCSESQVGRAITSLTNHGMELGTHYDLWIAHYGITQFPANATFWQDGDGHGALDHDEFIGDRDALVAWGGDMALDPKRDMDTLLAMLAEAFGVQNPNSLKPIFQSAGGLRDFATDRADEPTNEDRAKAFDKLKSLGGGG